MMLARSYLLGIGLLSLVSCKSLLYREKPKAKNTPQAVEQVFKKLKRDSRRKSLKQNIKDLQDFIDKNQTNNASFDAYIYQAKLYKKYGNRKEVCKIYQKALNLPYKYRLENQIILLFARCLANASQVQKALELLEYRVQNVRNTEEIKNKAHQLGYSLVKNRSGFLDWKLLFISRILRKASPKQQKLLRAQARDIINSLSDEDLKKINETKKNYGIFQSFILFKLGELNQKEGRFKEAKKIFKKTLSYDLSFSLEKQILSYLKILEAQNKVNPYLIGVILPLSGKRGKLGQRILRGLNLGLQINKDSPWQLIVVDSKNHKDVVKPALEKLLYKDHIISLVGGLSAEVASFLSETANIFKIPSIVLSQKNDLTQDRDFIFQNASTSRDLMTQFSSDVYKKIKLKKIAIFYPNDSYGKEYAKAFRENFTKWGGEILKEVSYSSDEVDFKEPLKQLFNFNNRKEEYEKAKAEFIQAHPQLSRKSKKLKIENLLKPELEFEGIFIPDTGKNLKKIQAYLKYFNIKDVHLLGTNLWKPYLLPPPSDDFPIAFINQVNPSKKELKSKDFNKNYRKIFNSQPGFFERQGYNTGVLLYKALSNGPKNRWQLIKRLKAVKTFEGAYGSIKISPEQTLLYPLKTYLSHKNKFYSLDSIPDK